VRTLCAHCKQPEPVDVDAWNLLTKPFKARPPSQFMKPVGCLECRSTGYQGRMGVYEIMLLTESVREIIKADTDIDTLRRQGIKDGMRTLRLSGAQKVGAGLTTIAEVLRVTPSTLS
jgi:general secretion pathway protein E